MGLSHPSTRSTVSRGMQYRNCATSSACSAPLKCCSSSGSSWASSLARCLRSVMWISATLQISSLCVWSLACAGFLGWVGLGQRW
jgi:hypothetical protein